MFSFIPAICCLVICFFCTAPVLAEASEEFKTVSVSKQVDRISDSIIGGSIALSIAAHLGTQLTHAWIAPVSDAFSISIAIMFPVVTAVLLTYKQWKWFDELCERPRTEFKGLSLDYVNALCNWTSDERGQYVWNSLTETALNSILFASFPSFGIYALAHLPFVIYILAPGAA